MSTREDEISRLRFDIDLCVRNLEFERAVKLQGRLLGLQQRIRDHQNPTLKTRGRVSGFSNVPQRSGRVNIAKN